jgi:hypothetical protein
MNIATDYFLPRYRCSLYDNPTNKPCANSLLIYGVDYMDTRDVARMFTLIGQTTKTTIKKIQWMDDSNVQIIFFTPEHVQAVLKHTLLEPSKYKIKAEEEGVDELPKEWFELKPYDILGIKRKL